ncbi:MAG: ABC transporter permease [Acidimicrobiales bacterium]
MLGAYSSEWVKLRRRSMLLGGLGALAFTVFATVLTIERVVKTIPRGPGDHHFAVTAAQLSRPDGLVHGVTRSITLLGIVVLCLFAGAMASEYSQGTLRNLLVRQPRRLRFLAGKYLALVSFTTIAVILAIAVAVGVAFALAPSKGVDTSAWTTGAGISALWHSVLDVTLACLGYGTLGMVLAILLRSPVLAVAVGVGYILPGEAIINAAWSSGESWLPGQLLSTLAQGGTAAVSYDHAGLWLLLYGTVLATGTCVLFRRRDV